MGQLFRKHIDILRISHGCPKRQYLPIRFGISHVQTFCDLDILYLSFMISRHIFVSLGHIILGTYYHISEVPKLYHFESIMMDILSGQPRFIPRLSAASLSSHSLGSIAPPFGPGDMTVTTLPTLFLHRSQGHSQYLSLTESGTERPPGLVLPLPKRHSRSPCPFLPDSLEMSAQPYGNHDCCTAGYGNSAGLLAWIVRVEFQLRNKGINCTCPSTFEMGPTVAAHI